jgi:hypothetical protein
MNALCNAEVIGPHLGLRAVGMTQEYEPRAHLLGGTAMRCGWGGGCRRPAAQAWMRGSTFANVLCQEHADSLRLVLPQAQFMRWSELEDASRRIEDPRVAETVTGD